MFIGEKMSNNLSEKSMSYYDESNIYKVFSDAEDCLNLVRDYLLTQVNNKECLDLGCGNGKYLDLLGKNANLIYGLDLSLPQLSLAGNKNLICADASQLPLKDKSVDLVYSCWMFGTITDDKKRLSALNDAKRVVKQGGKIILVENTNSGEFEKVRGRLPEQDSQLRTKQYNDWLINQGFIEVKRFQSYFNFSDDNMANDIFRKIWKDRLVGIVTKNITHDISIFEWSN